MMSAGGEPGDLGGVLDRSLVGGERLVEVVGRGGDEVLIDPALIGDVGEERVEQREVGAGIDREMQHAVLARLRLAGIDRDRAARIDDDDAALLVRLAGELLVLLVDRRAAKVRHPVVQEIVGLGLERVRADGEDRVRELGVLVAIVELADAHVARRVDLRIVGGAIVDADVLHLHRAEIELSGAPGVLVAAAGAAMIEGGDEEPVLALLVDHRGRDARDEVERVVPARRLHLAVAPDHRIGEPLQLGVAGAAVAHLGDARAADRAEAGIHHAVRDRA